ncbi:MAG TPA: EpsG family protein [Gallicola sp.]|nr:EpsG family protein [Gallicola sp.]
MIYSYILYFSSVLFASIFGGLAQRFSSKNKKGKVIPNKFYWYFSMLILFFIMGFRSTTVGVDDQNYLLSYNMANNTSIVDYYQVYTTEPAFYLLYRLVYVVFGNFQWVIIISSFITVYCFYKAIAYEIETISLSLAVFIFSCTQYFYYFGIIRMGLAVAIIVVAYRYILENKKKKYIFMVILATLFHYSALFSMILLFIKPDRIKKSTIFKIVLIIPSAFFAVRLFVYPFITSSRYAGYIESSGIIDYKFISALPFLLLFMIYYKGIRKNTNLHFYFILFLIKITTEAFMPIIGIGRMVWYVNLCLAFLLPATVRINRDYLMKFIILSLIIIYCFGYSYYAYFGSSHRGTFMIPYRNIFFEFTD